MFVVIPAKIFSEAKSRLSTVLGREERMALSQSLLLRTITLAGQVGEVVVVSRDPAARQLAKQAGAWALVETGHGLNPALQQAGQWIMARQGRTCLVLPADLPLLELTDLRGMVQAAGSRTPAAVIAPCRRGDGTNALLLRPPNLVTFSFGPGSFSRHRQAIRTMGLEPVVYTSPTLAFDLDLPEDWAELSGRRAAACR